MKKYAALIRPLDQLGRICVPAEILERFSITKKTPIYFVLDNDRIICTPQGCALCGAPKCVEFNGKLICHGCIEAVKKSL